MPKLILSVDDTFLDEYTLDKDTITIGRRTDNDICLDNLAVSGYHTQITTVLNDSFLEDLNSTNGTFVNSKIIKKHALKDGDIIDIGNHRIKYINHLATTSANSDFEKTVVMAPQSNQNQTDSAIQKNIDNSLAEVVNWIDAIADAHDADDQSGDASDIALSPENLAENLSSDDDLSSDSSDENNDADVIATDQESLAENLNSDDDFSGDINDDQIDEKSDANEQAIDQQATEQEDQLENNKITDEKVTIDPIEVVDKDIETVIEAEDKIEESSAEQDQTTESNSAKNESTANKIGRLQILSGSNCGKELELDKSLTTIGKPNVAVAGITKRSSGYFIIHLEGDDETASKLNGEIIEGKAQPLENHDIIDVAGIKLEFFLE